MVLNIFYSIQTLRAMCVRELAGGFICARHSNSSSVAVAMGIRRSKRRRARARAQLPTIDISLKIIPRYIIYLFAFSYRFFLPIGIREETDFVPANSTFLSLRPRNVRGCEDEVGVE